MIENGDSVPKPLLGILSPDPMFIYVEGEVAAIWANLRGFVLTHNILKVLVELFHRAVRGSVLVKHSGFHTGFT